MSAGASRITPGCDCPRCALYAVIEAHYTGEHLRDAKTGLISVDVSAIAADFGTVLGSWIQAIPDRGARRRALRFAHEAIDAGVQAAREDSLVLLTTGREQ